MDSPLIVRPALLSQTNSAPAAPHRPFRSLILWLAIGCLALAIVLLLLASGGGTSPIQPHVYGPAFELAAGGLGLWLLIIVAWWSRRRGKFDLFEPPLWISLNVYFQVVANVWLLQRDNLPTIDWVHDNYIWLMPAAVVLFGVALTILWGGYAWFYTRQARRLRKPVSERMRLPVIGAIWAGGTVIAVVATILGTSSYLGAGEGAAWANYVAFINVVTDAASAALVIAHFRRPTTLGWVWLGVVLSVNIALPLVAGSKSFALSFLWFIIYIYYAVGRLPKRLLLAGIMAIVVLVPVVNQYRLVLQNSGVADTTTLSGRLDSLSAAVSALSNQTLSNAVDNTRQTFEVRQGSILDLTASVIYLTPTRLPFVGNEMMGYFFQQLIPRIVWPDKPIDRPLILYITSTYGGASTEYTFSEIGLIADSYRAGGWPIVFGWFITLAAFSAWLYGYGVKRGSMAGLVFYVTVLTHILRYEADITTTLLYMLEFVPLIWFVVTRVMFVPVPAIEADR